MKIRVLLVDDETLVRHGVRKLLELSDRVEVVGEAADGEEALLAIDELRPEVVLLDLRMPRGGGLGVLAALGEREAAPPCLVLTTFDDRTLVLDAIRAGARGYLRKDVSLAQLLAAVEELAKGGSYLQPAVTETLVKGLTGVGRGPAPPPLVESLTHRETEVLRLMAAACTNREIAEALGTAEGTIKVHVSNVLGKLGARDRTHAVVKALELRLL